MRGAFANTDSSAHGSDMPSQCLASLRQRGCGPLPDRSNKDYNKTLENELGQQSANFAWLIEVDSTEYGMGNTCRDSGNMSTASTKLPRIKKNHGWDTWRPNREGPSAF